MKILNHVSRHLVGYATVLGAMAGVVLTKLESPDALTRRVIAATLVGAFVAGCSTITAYRIGPQPGASIEIPPSPSTPPVHENKPDPTPSASAAGDPPVI